MNPDTLKFLFDISDSIKIIESYLERIPNLASYKSDLRNIDAIERRLAIIGEALNKADKLTAGLLISDKNKIIGLRHMLIHDYDLIESEAIWIICNKNLPILKNEVQKIIDGYGAKGQE